MSETNSVPSAMTDAEQVPVLRAKHLGLRLPIAPNETPEMVPARMINEVLYCERLFYLEWVQGEFDDNWFTVDGRAVHKRPDKPGGQLPPRPDEEKKTKRKKAEPDDEDDAPVEIVEPPPYEARSVWLSSEKLGITAKIDIVEGDASGRVLPIEYKRGKAPDLPEGAYLPERAQICAQVLLLREHGYTCDEGAVYFAASKKRVPIPIDEDLIQITLEAAQKAKTLGVSGVLPPPLVDSPKCNGCSLVGICLPDETNLLRRLNTNSDEVDVDEEVAEEAAVAGIERDLSGALEKDPWGLADSVANEPEIRRLHPARDDKMPLYVQSQGGRVGLSGERITVLTKDGTKEARLGATSQVCLLGNVQVSTQAMKTLLDRAIPVAFFTTGGYYIGRATGYSSKNVELRIAQYGAARDKWFCAKFARGVVAAKIRNGRTMLRRNHEGVEASVLFELEQLAKKAETADAESLLGIEGTAARVYFSAFAGMVKGAPEVKETFDWNGRNRRPPKDPLNALLSFAYALLSKEYALALEAVGLDPMLGYYHRPRFGRPALALDLMEEMRPIVADSTVISAINNGVVGPDDFIKAAGSVAIRPEARKRFIETYERRMDQLVTHPIFGYRLSYRRVLEVQARLLGRVLLGEIDKYPSFRTR